MLFFLGVKYLIKAIIPEYPKAAKFIKKRHAYVIERAFRPFSKEGKLNYRPTNINLNIEGVEHKNIFEKETVSKRHKNNSPKKESIFAHELKKDI